MSTELEVIGLNEVEIVKLSELLDAGPRSRNLNLETTRGANELVSAAFILGALNAAPALIAQITELLSKARETKYVRFKLTSSDGETVLEGSASPDRIDQLAKTLNDFGAK